MKENSGLAVKIYISSKNIKVKRRWILKDNSYLNFDFKWLNYYFRFNNLIELLKYENAGNKLFSLIIPHLSVIDFVE